MNSMTRKILLASVFCSALAINPAFAETARPGDAAPPVVAATPGVTTATTSYADLAEKLLPAVVNISTMQKASTGKAHPGETNPDGDDGDDQDDPQGIMPQFPPGSPFEQFFKDFMERHGGQGGGGQAVPHRTASLGSGFIFDAPKGLIITNNHVIEDAEEINVILQDDTTLKAKLIGTDTKMDIAVLKVETKHPLVDVRLGDSDAMRVGDPVLAIGNPFGLGGTVTSGIISARARNINAGPYDDFLQTDASINRGNSGGPMFNMKGEVIGVNTAIFSPSGGSVGIGFAIPSNMVRSVEEQINKYGHTRRGWLGVRIQEVTDDIAEGLSLGKTSGALVASVTPGGPAEKAGIQAGDVIVKFDGKDVTHMRNLPRIVAETDIGKKSDIEIIRKGSHVTKQVQVGELENAEKTDVKEMPKPAKPEDQSKVKIMGLSLGQIDPGTAKQFELRDGLKGVVITSVAATSAAAEKGLAAGDVIVEVNQQPVTTPQDVAGKISDAKKSGRKSVLLLVESKGDLRFVALGLDDKGADKKDGPTKAPKEAPQDPGKIPTPKK